MLNYLNVQKGVTLPTMDNILIYVHFYLCLLYQDYIHFGGFPIFGAGIILWVTYSFRIPEQKFSDVFLEAEETKRSGSIF